MEDISDIYRAILAKPGVKMSPPADEAEFLEFEVTMEFGVPADLRSILSISDGAELSDSFRMLGLDESRQYCGMYERLKLLGLTDENDSNPYCLICASPLIGKVMHLSHDGDSTLAFNSLADFLVALRNHGTNDFYEREGIAKDISRTCLKTLAWAKEEDDSSPIVLAMAFSGLTEGHEDYILPYLNDKDDYVRSAAQERLTEIGTPAAKKAIYDDTLAYERFVADVKAVLTTAGIRVTENRQIGSPLSLRLDPGTIHLNMHAFYSRRHDPDIFQKILERSQHFLKNAQK